MNIFKTASLPGRTLLTTDGKEYLWFSGTDYLGMGHNADFRRFLDEGLDLYGMHYGSSRNGSVQLAVFQDAENAFADFVASEAALLTSSGMLAGRLLMQEIEHIVRLQHAQSQIHYLYAANAHPAIRGIQYAGTSLSWKESISDAAKKINNSPAGTAHILCTDATGSPFVQHYDFSILEKINNPEKVYLIIDQSHALGILGEGGKGILHQIPARFLPQTIFVSSLNKALGIPGGAIWGPTGVINTLRQSPWFAGASPAVPAYIHAFQQLLKGGFYQKALDQLVSNIALFQERLKVESLFHAIEGYPVFCSMNARLAEHLVANGIMPTHFPYPSPQDPPVTRVVISALHQQKDLDHLAEVCNAFKG